MGEKYQLITGVWDGQGCSYKTCRQCADLRERIHKITGCCVSLGSMRESLANFEEYEGHTPTQQSIWAEHNAIRVQRGAAISPAYKEEENEILELISVEEMLCAAET